jgi:hypothetical protein
MAEYITLVSSLPYLPPFEKAERSPITRLRLEQRLHSLEADDAKQLAIAEALVSWRLSLAKPKTDKEMVLRCRVALQTITQPALREFGLCDAGIRACFRSESLGGFYCVSLGRPRFQAGGCVSLDSQSPKLS